MVRQDGEPPADGEGGDGGGDRPLQDGEFAVDLDAQGLEGALGRVAAGALGGLRQGVADDLDQAGAGGEGLLGPLVDDGGDDASGLLLLAVGAQDPDQVAGGVGVEDLGGADAGRLVHPHVERGVLGVGEAAAGLVELHGGDAEVEEDALDAGDAEPLQHLGQLVVDGVDEGGAVAVAGEALAGEAQRLLVAVEGDEAGGGEGGEQGLAVAAEAEGAVDDDGARFGEGRGEEVEAAAEHHGDVAGVAVLGGRGLVAGSARRAARLVCVAHRHCALSVRCGATRPGRVSAGGGAAGAWPVPDAAGRRAAGSRRTRTARVGFSAGAVRWSPGAARACRPGHFASL